MDYVKPVLFTVTPFVGFYPTGVITRKAIKDWYDKDTLKKPWFRPPNWLFPPTWTSLYISMGYASYLVYRDGGGFHGDARNALALYGTQLALNWAWTPIFFGQKKLGLAYLDIMCLAGCIGGTIIMFAPINKTASYLLYPYLAWVSFASMLNLWIWRNNPPQDKCQ